MYKHYFVNSTELPSFPPVVANKSKSMITMMGYHIIVGITTSVDSSERVSIHAGSTVDGTTSLEPQSGPGYTTRDTRRDSESY